MEYGNELYNRNFNISGLLDEKKWILKVYFPKKGGDSSAKTMVHIHRLFKKFGFDKVFGRSSVMELLELKGSGASKFLSNLLDTEIIETVSGYRKGKYKFKR